jgi:SRSO17 transposase
MGTILGPQQVASRGLAVSVEPKALASLVKRLNEFLRPYLPLFGRPERQVQARRAVQGLLSDLERKSAEPIAELHGQPRRAMQHFIGAGPWSDQLVLDLLVDQVADELGSVDGVLIIDPTSFPKKGTESVGVGRHWCGRLGKIDNCQVGVFLGYASKKGHTLVDCRLYLDEGWAADKARREKCYVPKAVVFQRSWELAAELITCRAASLPHRWIVADEEFGRPTEFRDLLAARGERYMLEVPCTTSVKVLGQVPHAGRRPNPKSVSEWAEGLPKKGWKLFTVRDGTKGPLQVWAAWTRVVTKDDPSKKKSPWTRKESLLVIKTVGQQPQTKYFLCNAEESVTLQEMVQAACTRWRVEDSFERAKGQVGLHHYEVRSWTGWHHHMTLGMMALWFLVREHSHLHESFPPSDRSAAPGLLGCGPSPASHARPALCGGPATAHAERTGAPSPLGQRESPPRGREGRGRLVTT